MRVYTSQFIEILTDPKPEQMNPAAKTLNKNVSDRATCVRKLGNR